MDDKCIDAMSQYYNLKQQYENSIQKQKLKIMSNTTLSKKEKRDRFIRIKKKCINCKNPGGTIFTTTGDRLKAVCGSAEPCNLNIEIFKSRFTDREELRLYSSDLDKSKTYIIMTKLDFLFGYKTEDETLVEFEEKRLNIAKITDKIYKLENHISNIVDNKENHKMINHIQTMLNDDVNELKEMYKKYLKEENSEILKEMVEIYMSKIKPQGEEIRKLNYMFTGIDYNDDNNIYTLIELPYTRDKMEIPDEKCMIVSNVV